MHWTYDELQAVPFEVYEVLVEELHREAEEWEQRRSKPRTTNRSMDFTVN
jgi:hypothetical protein